MKNIKIIILEEISQFLNEDRRNFDDIDEFFEWLENNGKPNTFVYVYATAPAKGNKFLRDEYGNKTLNPYLGKILRHSQYEIHWKYTYAKRVKKNNPDYEFTGKKTGFGKHEKFTVLRKRDIDGKPTFPILPYKQRYKYTILLDDGKQVPISNEEAEKYITPSKNGNIPYRNLFLENVYKINGGGATYTNPDFKYGEYYGPISGN